MVSTDSRGVSTTHIHAFFQNCRSRFVFNIGYLIEMVISLTSPSSVVIFSGSRVNNRSASVIISRCFYVLFYAVSVRVSFVITSSSEVSAESSAVKASASVHNRLYGSLYIASVSGRFDLLAFASS